MINSPHAAVLPPLEQWHGEYVDTFDAIVLAAGFEDRAQGLAINITARNTAQAVVVDYRPKNERNRLDELRGRLETAGIATKVLQYDRFRPNGFCKRLEGCLRDSAARKLLIDISAMSKLLIMLVLEVARHIDAEVTLHYAEAEEYAPTLEEYETAVSRGLIHPPSLEVYTGVHGVVRVPELSSVAMQGQPTAVLAFMSLNEQLTQALINTVYPSRLYLINGTPPEFAWREKATAWIHGQLMKEWPKPDNPTDEQGMPKRATSTLMYDETTAEVDRLYWELSPYYRIILAPTGSKMQCVGAYLAKCVHPDIHIEYPTPEGFFQPYSEGIGRFWWIKFGNINLLIARLRQTDRDMRLSIPGV